MRQKTGFEQQVFEGAEEFAIKMGDIIHKMRNQVPETLFGFYVFLATYMTKSAIDSGSAI